RNRDSRVCFCTESSICSLRLGNCCRVAQFLAEQSARSALGSGLCLASTAGNGSGGQGAHRYFWRPVLVGVLRRAGAPLAYDCCPGIWLGCRSEIAPDCVAASLLEACSCARRCTGSSRGWTPIHTVSQSRPDSDRPARHLRAEFPL